MGTSLAAAGPCLRKIVLALIASVPAACGMTTGPRQLFGDPTVYTPYFEDNRVFYIKSERQAGEGDVHRLYPPRDLLSQTVCDPSSEAPDCLRVPEHRDPLGVVVKSVYLPRMPAGAPRFHDIALIMEYSASQETSPSPPLVVWYQRNVSPGQALNFSDLVVAYTETWDDRYAPYFRFRLVDVAVERNNEIGAQLTEATKASSVLLPYVGVPLASAATASSTAAQAVLRNRRNRVLLDYTVQLYSRERAARHRNARFNILLDGRYAVFGRRLETTSPNYWSGSEFYFDEDASNVRGSATTQEAPIIVLAVVNDELLVPTTVLARSAELTKRLTEASTQNAAELEALTSDLHARVKAYAAREDLFKNNSYASIQDLIMMLGDPDTPADVKQYILLTIRRVSRCEKLDLANYAMWWDANRGVGVKREGGRPVLTDVDCGAIQTEAPTTETGAAGGGR